QRDEDDYRATWRKIRGRVPAAANRPKFGPQVIPPSPLAAWLRAASGSSRRSFMSRPHRRHFLQSAVAAGLTTNFLLGDDKKASGNDALRVGIIGVAGQGDYDMNEIARAGATIAALCDVDEKRATKARERFPKARFHTDFRRMLD